MALKYTSKFHINQTKCKYTEKLKNSNNGLLTSSIDYCKNGKFKRKITSLINHNYYSKNLNNIHLNKRFYLNTCNLK